ncbi:laccase domain-containing protein, partial [Escherichia coli]|nr:laccase domain-containing protein [Escherichia coli]
HGFFTRRGGASSGVFEGLNCGQGSTDLSEVVQINRSRAAKAMDVDLAHLAQVHPVHSADVAVVDGPQNGAPPVADALVSATPGMALAILTADCQPVLFADHQAGVIGAAHAGWRGAMDGVLEATLDAMEGLGAHRKDITAVIGPCISQGAYEVSHDFFENFMADDPDNQRFFSNGVSPDKLQFDLPAYGLHRQREAGT